MRSQRTTLPRVCAHCGADFRAEPNQIRSGRGRFCSPVCARRGDEPLMSRFMRQVNQDGSTPGFRSDLGPCWIWMGPMRPNGYGQIQVAGKLKSAHRLAYELFIGATPSDLVTDHLCRNPRCVNPTHLELVTVTENTRRGTSPSAINARKTHCLNGHAFTPENTWIDRRNRRACRACARDRSRMQYRKGRA